MKVQGVDPVILNRIQEKVKKQAVRDMRQVEFVQDDQGSRDKEREAPDREALSAAVQKLNKTADSLGIDLFFVLLEEDFPRAEDSPRVFLVNRATKEPIRELGAMRVMAMLTEMRSFVGMMVDQLL